MFHNIDRIVLMNTAKVARDFIDVIDDCVRRKMRAQ
jgi:hypothetical protein